MNIASGGWADLNDIHLLHLSDPFLSTGGLALENLFFWYVVSYVPSRQKWAIKIEADKIRLEIYKTSPFINRVQLFLTLKFLPF